MKRKIFEQFKHFYPHLANNTFSSEMFFKLLNQWKILKFCIEFPVSVKLWKERKLSRKRKIRKKTGKLFTFPFCGIGRGLTTKRIPHRPIVKYFALRPWQRHKKRTKKTNWKYLCFKCFLCCFLVSNFSLFFSLFPLPKIITFFYMLWIFNKKHNRKIPYLFLVLVFHKTLKPTRARNIKKNIKKNFTFALLSMHSPLYIKFGYFKIIN